ncbi:carbonic anhydrase-like [Cheilinus undulatus]|uniref:carbonic anhydrase-like n=1 Tax=Cheilinus undulatus TaxID=241271 RepID=UPI001BD52201|nr:carbonic anhydrase-like [Cheilinus undulatus]
MHLSSFLTCLALGTVVNYAAGSDWCYTGCEHTPTHWKDIPGSVCGGNRQSPIDINPSHVKTDKNLHNFTFTNFSSQNVIKSLKNNNHTVKLTLKENEVEVSGGGLNGTYSTLQFHFHWGKTEHHPGSEHTIDKHRYPMEMHVVNLKKDLSEPAKNPEGIAVLAFFIDATDDGDMTGPWGSLTSYLTNNTDSEVAFTHNISINDLIGDVDRTKFYRYMGSLTTPNCSEAVVWTIFQDPIKVNKDLIEMFPKKTGVSNVFRPSQNINGRQVYASPATTLPSSHPWCYDDHCEFSPSKWKLLPQSFCGGERQSPININTSKTVTNKQLTDFGYTKFEDKRAVEYITNTGHAIKCVLKEDLVAVSGGGLGHVYTTLQFHFHWGSMSEDSEGSEHTVDSHSYPMEMHIVSRRKDLSLEDAVNTPNGLSVLGFFIEATDSTKSSSGGSSHHETSSTSKPTSDMNAWKKLTSYLPLIQNISSKATVTEEISIDDLLGDVDRAAYYRYNGSLTTPSCNEAVVWTVFKESIKVDKDLMKMFPTHAGYKNVFRPAQDLHNRTVFTTKSTAGAPVPVLLFLLLACFCALSYNLNLFGLTAN